MISLIETNTKELDSKERALSEGRSFKTQCVWVQRRFEILCSRCDRSNNPEGPGVIIPMGLAKDFSDLYYSTGSGPGIRGDTVREFYDPGRRDHQFGWIVDLEKRQNSQLLRSIIAALEFTASAYDAWIRKQEAECEEMKQRNARYRAQTDAMMRESHQRDMTIINNTLLSRRM